MKKLLILFLVVSWVIYPFTVQAGSHKRLVAIGDSIPYGYNLTEDNKMPPKEAFPYLIAQELDLEVTNLAIPGLTSGELLQAIRSNSIFRNSLKNADYVIVYIGGNDLLNIIKKNGGIDGITMKEVAPVIRDLIYNVYSSVLEIDQLTDGKILVYNIYNPYSQAGDKLGTPLSYINQQYKSLIQLLSHFTTVRLINAHKAFVGHPEYIIKGDVHPTKEGQKALAKLGLEHIE